MEEESKQPPHPSAANNSVEVEATATTAEEEEKKSVPVENGATTNTTTIIKEEWEIKRDEHKSEADDAFRAKNFPKAIQEYTNAITFDPELHILYSNRSAAYLSNGEKSRALADAKKCVELKPDFVKGHSRLASSMISLGRLNEARGVYRYILKELDCENVVAKKGLEDIRARELKVKEQEREVFRRAQIVKEEEEEKKKKEKQEEEEKRKAAAQEATRQEEESKDVGNEEEEEDDDDLLNDFFDEVEDVKEKKKPPEKEEEKSCEEIKENKIQIQLSDLGDTKTQIDRILCSNHEWYNLNPFRVLDISHEAPLDLLSRRYKALSLLLHPDKVRVSNNDLAEKAEEAFEYIRKAINTLKDEIKAKHIVDLIVEGRKMGKMDYEAAKNNKSLGGKTLEKFQEIATMKIFAEVERKRRDVERRKRKFEEKEREEEDAEQNKAKKEREFDKDWKQEGRVDKRINNWRDFSKKKKKK